MHLTLSSISLSRISLCWEIPADEVNSGLDRAEASMRKELERISRRPQEWKKRGLKPLPPPQNGVPIALRGFRPKAIPRDLLWREVGGEIRRRYIEEIIPALWRETVESQGLQLAGRPQFQQVEVNRDTPLTLQAEVDILPILGLTRERYQGLYVEVPARGEVTPAVIDQAMEQLKVTHVLFRALPAEALVEMGDYVQMRYADRPEGQENWTPEQQVGFVLGDGQMFQGFEGMILGGQRGQQRTFQLPLPQGGVGEFQVVIEDHKRRELPSMERIAAEKGMADVAELKEWVARQVEENFALQHEINLRIAILSKVIGTPFPLPEAMVQARFGMVVQDARISAVRQGRQFDGSEENKRRLWALTEQRVREEIALDEIARLEGFVVSGEEFSAEIDRLATRESRPREEILEELRREGKIPLLEKHLLWTKTLRWLIGESRVTEVMEIGNGSIL